MDVALRGLDQGVTEQLGDGHHVHAIHGGDRSPAVSEVMQANAVEAGAPAEPRIGAQPPPANWLQGCMRWPRKIGQVAKVYSAR